MSGTLFGVILAGSALFTALFLYLGFVNRKQAHLPFDVRSYFPYELFEGGKETLSILLRVIEAFSLLSLLGLPAELLALYSYYGGTGLSYLWGIFLFQLLFAVAFYALTLVPAGQSKLHLSLFFLSDGFAILSLSSQALFYLHLVDIDGRKGLYAFSVVLFLIALALLILLVNPRLSHWAEMKKKENPDGSLSYERPCPFVLAASEWLLFALLLLGNALSLIAYFLIG